MATTLTAENREYIPTRWEDVACPFCHANDRILFEKFGFQHRFTYVQCQSCQLVYQSPRPVYNTDFVDTAYAEYSDLKDGFMKAGSLTERGEIVYREYSHILKEIESYVTHKEHLLEIGCNTGFFCKVAADRSWKPTGVEISKKMADYAHQTYGIETRVGDWLQIQLPHRYDAIYSSHVIEHIPNPREWMTQFKNVLAPGGILCLSVPNMQSIDRKWKRMLKRLGLKKDRWEKWRTPDHLYEPCEKSFSQFIRSCGFEIVKTYSYPSEWDGSVDLWHSIYQFKLRWGAKSRYYLRPL